MVWVDKLTAQRLSEPIEDIYADITDRLVENIAKHLREGDAKRTADWEVRKLQELGMLTKENAKIMFRIKANQMEEVESYFQAHPSPNYIGFKTQPTLFEFTNIHTDKGYALRQYCEINGLSPEQVMAFGDTSNDNGMLEYSGLGVCLKNGSEDTKAIADVVTDRPCTMDGWADFMEKYFDRRQQDGE